MQDTKKETFTYSYSASEQEEVTKIRDKYLPKEESKLEQLRRLDAGVTNRATLVSIVTGTIGALILGLGMCCVMVWRLFILGIPIGLIGIVGVALAYPAYHSIMKKERQRLAPQILALTEELLKQN